MADMNDWSAILCIATALWWHSGRNAVMVKSLKSNGDGERWRGMAGRKVMQKNGGKKSVHSYHTHVKLIQNDKRQAASRKY